MSFSNLEGLCGIELIRDLTLPFFPSETEEAQICCCPAADITRVYPSSLWVLSREGSKIGLSPYFMWI